MAGNVYGTESVPPSRLLLATRDSAFKSIYEGCVKDPEKQSLGGSLCKTGTILRQISILIEGLESHGSAAPTAAGAAARAAGKLVFHQLRR